MSKMVWNAAGTTEGCFAQKDQYWPKRGRAVVVHEIGLIGNYAALIDLSAGLAVSGTQFIVCPKYGNHMY